MDKKKTQSTISKVKSLLKKPKETLIKAVSGEKKEKKLQSRLLKGVIVSDKMDKTVVVAVTRYKKHPKYKKKYKVTKKYKVHDEKNEYKTGDQVVIQECRPMSKDKRWVVKSLVQNRKK